MELYLKLAMLWESLKNPSVKFFHILYIGQTGRDIFNTMSFTEDETDKLDILFTKFGTYCKPKQNITVERYHFNTHAQELGESIDQNVTELKLIASELESQLIRDRIVCGVKSETVKQRLLRAEDLTLDRAISICRAEEQSKKNAQLISEEQAVHGLCFRTPKGRGKNLGRSSTRDKRKQVPTEDQAATVNYQCDKCGLKHPRKQCPAYGKQCLNCGKHNHFAKFCKGKKKVQTLSQSVEPEQIDDDVLFIDAVTKQGQTKVKSDECFSTLDVQGTPIRFKIDTGSQANIIPLRKLQSFQHKPVVRKSTTKLTSYSGEELQVKGQCMLECQGHELQFFVVDTEQDPVLSFRASHDLGNGYYQSSSRLFIKCLPHVQSVKLAQIRTLHFVN